jgi:uncharacterized protein (DUF1501 family)
MISRRRFLQASSLVSLSPMLPTVFSRTARAASAAPDERALVVIQLDGGNDGINTVVPFGDDAYGRARNELRLKPDKLHKLDDYTALQSGMKSAKELLDDGRLAIVQGVGYPNPNRSHFTSMKIWQTARFDQAEHDGYGWLGRTLDVTQVDANGGGNRDAIFVGDTATPVALWGRRSSAISLSRDEDLQLQSDRLAKATTVPSSATEDLEQFVSKQILAAYDASEQFGRATASDQSSEYPDTELATRLQLVSKLLKSGFRSRVYYTVQSGYDTHSAQLYAHYRLLREFSGALKAFLDDLRASGLDDRVIVLAFSEFGRRVAENDSAGTDHGTAGPVFLAGSHVNAGLIGESPDLNDLVDGDLKMKIDFRQVYATLSEQWLGVESKQILGGAYESVPVLKV